MAKNIAWIDVETTGLNLHEKDRLLQVACIITDEDFNELAEPFEMKVQYPSWLVGMLMLQSSDYVKDMHKSTGLWDALSTEGRDMRTIDSLLSEYITKICGDEAPFFGGNSIFLDRTALMLNLPKTYSNIYYRSIDMSSIAEYLRMTKGIESFEKKSTHNALEDIRESIEEAKYYSKILKG